MGLQRETGTVLAAVWPLSHVVVELPTVDYDLDRLLDHLSQRDDVVVGAMSHRLHFGDRLLDASAIGDDSSCRALQAVGRLHKRKALLLCCGWARAGARAGEEHAPLGWWLGFCLRVLQASHLGLFFWPGGTSSSSSTGWLGRAHQSARSRERGWWAGRPWPGPCSPSTSSDWRRPDFHCSFRRRNHWSGWR